MSASVCPAWCQEDLLVVAAGEACQLHRGVTYSRRSPESSVTAIELAIGQAVGPTHGPFNARAALRVWDSAWGAAMGPAELRELAAAATDAAATIEAAGGEQWQPEPDVFATLPDDPWFDEDLRSATPLLGTSLPAEHNVCASCEQLIYRRLTSQDGSSPDASWIHLGSGRTRC